MVAEHDGKGSF